MLLFLGLLQTEYNDKDTCHLWTEALKIQVLEMQNSYGKEFSLSKVYSSTFESSLWISDSNIDFLEYELPYYNEEYLDASITSNNNIRNNEYKLINNEMSIYLTHYKLSELDQFDPEDEQFIHQDFLEIEGYLEIVKNTSHWELMDYMLTNDFENFDCNLNSSTPLFIYGSKSKFALFRSNSDWYKVTTKDLRVIIEVNFRLGEITYEYFIGDDLMQVFIQHSQPIEKNKFISWISNGLIE
ncbi:hypothetical protein QNI24_05020 [Marinicella sp. X102]|nr:hypothetical protein [Marinicella marina]